MTALARVQAALTHVRAALGIGPSPREAPDHGQSFASGQSHPPSFNPAIGMAAFSRFPWLYAALSAIVSDLSQVPRVVRVKGTTETLPDHPVAQLFANPTPGRMTADLWYKQRLLYLILTGNSYTLMVGGARPVALPLLHPEHVTIEPSPSGGPRSYVFDPGATRSVYSPEDIVHLRQVSWQSTPSALYGTGVVEPLLQRLKVEHGAIEQSAAMSRVGRPTVIITPTDPGTVLQDEARKRIAESYERLAATGGALVIDKGVKVDIPAWTPRDMEFSSLTKEARDAVLAVLGVPPTVVGIPGANFATAQMERALYWGRLAAWARMLDISDQRIVDRFDRRLEIVHDLSNVEDVRMARATKLQNAAVMVSFGADPAEAMEAEGLIPPPSLKAPRPPAPADPERGADALARMLATPSAKAIAAPVTRAATWAELADTVAKKQRPSIVKISQLSRAGFEKQLKAVTSALMELAPAEERTIRTAVPIDALLSAAEKALSAEDFASLGPWLKAALERAYKGAKSAAGSKTVIASSGTVDQVVRAQLGDLVGNLNTTTAKAVKAALQAAVDQGLSLSEITTQLAALPEFTPARALMVARTEVGKSYGAGTDLAYKALADEGIRVKKTWLARPDARPEHRAMDGQTVEVDAVFTSPDGHTAKHPGGFGVARLDINCTCVESVIVMEDE